MSNDASNQTLPERIVPPAPVIDPAAYNATFEGQRGNDTVVSPTLPAPTRMVFGTRVDGD